MINSKQEQYSRRDCLLLYGIPENKNEKTDDLCFAIINEHLELSITEADIERTHRTEKSRPIIVKFVRYNDRKKVGVWSLETRFELLVSDSFIKP